MNPVKTQIVKIGNSRGIRIPKPFLEQVGLERDVEILAQHSQLVIRPLGRPRSGWDSAFRALAQNGDDALLDLSLPTEWDQRVVMVVKRFDVFLIALDPTLGSEIQKTRPCLIISPDEMNRHIATVIVAPMAAKGQVYPTRVPCRLQGKDGQIVLDQLRTADKARLLKRLGRINPTTQKLVLDVLAEMFAE